MGWLGSGVLSCQGGKPPRQTQHPGRWGRSVQCGCIQPQKVLSYLCSRDFLPCLSSSPCPPPSFFSRGTKFLLLYAGLICWLSASCVGGDLEQLVRRAAAAGKRWVLADRLLAHTGVSMPQSQWRWRKASGLLKPRGVYRHYLHLFQLSTTKWIRIWSISSRGEQTVTHHCLFFFNK